ncbi:hypothetical protein EYR40_006368 [Pleurotus pulmonarius]|nr:hypothetical protein EYR36_010989 [Pleurotus pulmonarius]KAF4599276.1 hypothetical protein EYR40_006368 [Pleurotus pulmonarius]
MKYSILALSVLAVSLPVLAVNGPCTANGTPGVCISTSSCSSGGGQSFSGLCPNDPADVRCCTKTSCGAGGNCRFTSACTTGNTAAGLCPGPATFQCCLPASGGGGGGGSGGGCPPVNAATINMIKSFEHFVPNPAPDPVGILTVGYGHKCIQPGCTEAGPFPLTEAGAVALMQRDLHIATTCLNPAISSTVRLNDNQFGALADWAFNVGCGAMRNSTLVSRLNNGEDPNTVAAQELPRWNMAGGQVSNGLIRRRAAEVALFQTASSVVAHPC